MELTHGWGQALFLMLWVTALIPEGRATNLCDTCDEEKCPELQYCIAEIVKDHCDCCTVCSTDLYSPEVEKPEKTNATQKGHACAKVQCKKFQVCMENMQGLPLCTCPSMIVCKNYKKPVCGSDDQTYQSRCHMRVTACNINKRIKAKYKGPCTHDFQQNGILSDKLNFGTVGVVGGDVQDTVPTTVGQSNTSSDHIKKKRQKVKHKKKRRKSKRKKPRRNRRKKDKTVKKRNKRRNKKYRNKQARYLKGKPQRYWYFRY